MLEGVAACHPVPQQEVDASQELAVRREIGEGPEVRLLHQVEHLFSVVASREVAGDDRAGARTSDVLPGLDRFRRVLCEPAERSGECEPFYTAAAEDPI